MRNHFLRAAAGNVSSAPNIVTTNLVQYYDFGNTACYDTSVSTVNITDLSGNNNHANFRATTTVPAFSSSNGGYIQPSNSTQYAVKGTVGTLAPSFMRTIGTSDFTIELWMNLYSQSGNDEIYFDNPSEIAFSPQFVLNFWYMNIYQSGSFKLLGQGLEGSTNFYHINLTAGTSTPTIPQINIDTTNHYSPNNQYHGWEHFVASRTSTGTNGMTFYRNNTVIDTRTNSINYNSVAQNGGILQDSVHYFKQPNSRHAILRFYLGHGLTATEVDQNYQAEKARFGLS